MSLPIIDVEKYFNDPSIPDGSNVGFVSPQGVVHDRFGKAIGIDSKHENAKNQDVLERLRKLVEVGDRGSVAQLGKPVPTERKIEKAWSYGDLTLGLDNFGDLWGLEFSGWQRAKQETILPPLPQGA